MKRLFTLLALCVCLVASAGPKVTIKGRVTAQGKPVEGVLVSDGAQIVKTDSKGRYALVSDKRDSVVFITTPSGFIARSQDGCRPGFWALLTKPAGKPETHDFVLVPQNQDSYRAIFISDVHFSFIDSGIDTSCFRTQVFPYLKQYAKESTASAVYTFNLGDFSHDSKWYEHDFDEADAYEFMRSLGYPTPVYSVSGNHDNDGAVINDADVNFKAAWLYRHVWGPDRFSLNIGKDHWILMDNIVYNNTPVDKIKNKGILGKRDYEARFTQAQLEWLKKDISFVPDGTRIYLCCHCPVFNTANKSECIPQEQVAILDEIFSRFDKVTVYSGHAHMMHIPATGKYSRFEQYVLPATSGSMWQTQDRGFQSISGDGTDAGAFIGDYRSEAQPHYTYKTFAYGEKAMRVYDMNEVGRYYRENADVRFQMEHFSAAKHDFSQAQYTNQLFINYWFYRPGETVKAYENGKEIEVLAVQKFEDPLYNVCYFVPETIKAGGYKKSLEKFRWPHMFVAKASTATSSVQIKVFSAQGALVRELTISRPKAFDVNID